MPTPLSGHASHDFVQMRKRSKKVETLDLGSSGTAGRPGAAKHGPPASGIEPRWEPYYRRLLQLRDYLLDQQHDLTMRAREISPNYLQREAADVASEDFERDLELGKITADQEMLNEIEEALDRIENGAYGICQMTGKAIPKGRLKAVPWTRYSVEAEKEIEQRGGGLRTILAPAQRLRWQFEVRGNEVEQEEGEEEPGKQEKATDEEESGES